MVQEAQEAQEAVPGEEGAGTSPTNTDDVRQSGNPGKSDTSSDSASEYDAAKHYPGTFNVVQKTNPTPQRYVSVEHMSCKVQLHGGYLAMRRANEAAMELMLKLAKPDNFRFDDNLTYKSQIVDDLCGRYEEAMEKGGRPFSIEWEPPGFPNRWPFMMLRVWVEEVLVQGPVDFDDMIVSPEDALVGEDRDGEVAGEYAVAGEVVGRVELIRGENVLAKKRAEKKKRAAVEGNKEEATAGAVAEDDSMESIEEN